MHWALIVLRLTPNAFDKTKAMEVLGAHLTELALLQEASYLRSRPRFERPYGWGWALTFIHELTLWEDEAAAKWLATVRPLSYPRCYYRVVPGMASKGNVPDPRRNAQQ